MIAIDQQSGRKGISHWGIFGFLVADLFTALAMLFLVANTQGNFTAPPGPTPVFTPTATPSICGLEKQPSYSNVITVPDGFALENQTSGAEADFQQRMRDQLGAFVGKKAGFVQVWGGSDVHDGVLLAQGATQAILTLGQQGFIFDTQPLIQSLWDGSIGGNQVRVTVFFYVLSTGGGSCR